MVDPANEDTKKENLEVEEIKASIIKEKVVRKTQKEAEEDV